MDCSGCKTTINSSEELIVAKSRKFHKNCFKCSVCNTPLEGENFTGVTSKGIYSIYCKTHAPPPKPINHNIDPLLLFQASKEGDVEKVKKLIADGVNVDWQNSKSWNNTALFAAAQYGHLDVVNALLDADVDVNLASTEFISPMWMAARFGYCEITKLLLERGSDVDIENTSGQSSLSISSYNGHLEVVKLLLKHGASINKPLKIGRSPLWQGSWGGHVEIVKMLLDRKADVNVGADNDNLTPLHMASQMGHVQVAQMLLDHGADINSATKKLNRTAVYFSASEFQPAIAKLLISRGADVNIASTDGPALHLAIQYNPTPDIANALMNAGADANSKTAFNENIGFISAIYGQVEIWSKVVTPEYLPTIPTSAKQRSEEEKEKPSGYTQTGSSGPTRVLGESIMSSLAANRIELDQWLGHGAFGDVYSGKIQNDKIAIKFLQKANEEQMKDLVEETSLLGGIKHPYVIQHRIFIEEIPAIVMELASYGNLNDFLKIQQKPVDWIIRMKWAMQISNAMLFIHRAGIVHRDLRCVNILLSGNLDIKLSDFGVSLWIDSNDDVKKKPFYVGQKGIYEMENVQDSYQFAFDLRLFSIILAKLLLAGDEMEMELYDFKTQKLTKAITCEKQCYLDLMDLCFDKSMTTALIATVVRSISLHEFTKFDPPKPTDEKPIYNKLKDLSMKDSRRIALVWARWVENKSDKLLETLAPFLREKGEDAEIQDHTIAALATMKPDILKAKSKIFTDALARAQREDAENFGETVNNLIGQVNNAEYLNGRTLSLQALAKLNWALDSRILDTIFKKLDKAVEWEIRVVAADELHRMAPGDLPTLEKLLAIVIKEADPKVKCQMALTLGTFKWAVEKVIPILENMLQDNDLRVRRRSGIAIGKLGASEELKTRAAVVITQNGEIGNLDWKEKVAVAEGIGLLRSPDDIQVQTIFKLLSDDNEEVKRAAGKALSQLNMSM